MKIRLDFVTNSSTSSYICDVCGDLQSGRDLCLSDAEMMECVNSHVVCESHVDMDVWGEDEPEEYPYEVPSEFCPICSLKHVRDKDMLDYVLKMAGPLFPGKDKLGEEIRRCFHNLEELKGWCGDESKK